MRACSVWVLRAHVECLREGRHTHGPLCTAAFPRVCERVCRQESEPCVHVLTVCRPPPLAAVQAPLPGLPVSWEPQDPEGGKLLPADVAKMDWIYLD